MSQTDDLREAVKAAQLQADLAKLDLVVAEARASLRDERLSFIDVAHIRHAARQFGVSELNAYRRARQLCLLSYQEEPVE